MYSSFVKKAKLLKEINLSNKRAKITLFLQFILILSLFYPVFTPEKANATVTEAFVRLDRHATGEAISGTACLKSTLTTQTNVVIVFPLDWTISQTASNWTVSTTNLPRDPVGGGAATAWPGIGTATSVNGVSVVFPGSALVAATFYCFNFAGASSTIGAAGPNKTGQLKTQGGSPYTDSVDWATSIVSSGSDQITVTASVSATMTFSLNANSVSLGTLSTAAVTYDSTGITQTVSTNARNGWISWVKSTNAALSSATASDTIPSAAWTTGGGNVVDLASVAGYVLDVVPGSGTPTITAEYDGDGDSSGGNLDTQFRQTASKTTPADSNVVTLHVAARAGATDAAASDYTDTLTVVASGSF